MGQFTTGRARTFKAGADLSTKQYYIVKFSAGNVVLSAAATDVLLGVVENKPTSGDNASVVLRSAQGTGKVIAGGSITAGNFITSDANGAAVATTTNKDQILGVALVDAAAGDIFEYMPATGTLSA